MSTQQAQILYEVCEIKYSHSTKLNHFQTSRHGAEEQEKSRERWRRRQSTLSELTRVGYKDFQQINNLIPTSRSLNTGSSRKLDILKNRDYRVELESSIPTTLGAPGYPSPAEQNNTTSVDR